MKRPREQFSKGDVMGTKVNGTVWKGSFRTEDPGKKGGLQVVHGKLATDIERLGREDAPTKTQKYTVEEKDFTVQQGRLIPLTTRGKRELRDIKEDVGELTHIGGKEFIPTREKATFKKYSYLRGSSMPRYKKGISPQEVSGARRRGIPESIIQKMVRSQELTQREKDVLNARGLGYKVGFTKDDGTRVRSHTFALKGGGKRGRSGGGSSGSGNPGRSPIEVKPSLPRGAYS